MRLQSWIALRKSSLILIPAAAILSFVIRLGLVAVVLVVLALWTPLNILALCISFIVVFTILTGISLYKMLVRRHGIPPSAGTTGAN